MCTFCLLKGARDSNMVEFKSPFSMSLFMVSPNREERIQINHPAASANCSDVPIFRLVKVALSHSSSQPDSGSVSLPEWFALPSNLNKHWH
ncbi:unnamed protein product [Hydatigera taeniaeformis]|uniref:Ovule protein n=1 Tax=Hydatigena taeniaeformis TaxID=6205 RepID=A0A0R3XD04_HYDTA|nr:unnamed protein product [Hydatigera taeniaeformis]